MLVFSDRNSEKRGRRAALPTGVYLAVLSVGLSGVFPPPLLPALSSPAPPNAPEDL